MITTITEVGSAAQAVFNLPLHDKTATATKNGSNAPITSQTDTSITLTTPVAAGDIVAITFNSVNLAGRKASGNLAATGSVTLDSSKNTSVAIQVAGTFVATVSFEGTIDGTNWQPLLAIRSDTGVGATSATAPGLFKADTSGLAQVRARVSAYTSGTANIALGSTGL